MALHEIPLERRTLHGHFSRDLEPILTVDVDDSIAFACLSSGWRTETGELFEPRDDVLDAGHALIGPVEVRGCRAGQTLVVGIDQVVVGSWGWCAAADWSTPLNDRLALSEGPGVSLDWTLDAGSSIGRSERGHELDLHPFLGVLGMPPPEPGIHPTAPPRIWGGNIDCAELGEGTTLYLPVPVDGALFSAGDGHAVQGDGEVSGTAIESPTRAQLTLDVRDEPALEWPVARLDGAWITLGFDENISVAGEIALNGMLALMERELGVSGADALALASLVVDLRATQVVNGSQGAHAVLRDGALRAT